MLVTNDDGVRSPGIKALALGLNSLARVVVVAPDRNRSAVGHAVTLERPLRAEEIKQDVFAVDGTPTDCVHLGIHGLINMRPDLVVSGVNRGCNVGDDITYSGTVSAALEAALMGLPSFAVSLDSGEFEAAALQQVCQFSCRLAQRILQQGLPEGTFLNVNAPSRESLGVQLTRQGQRRYGGTVVCNEDPRGRKYYWIGGSEVAFEDCPGTDSHALKHGYISVTPLKTNFTHEGSYRSLQGWFADDEAF